ncbi:MAG: M48 family metallopeptidase [Burkholderiaceae bacterium]
MNPQAFTIAFLVALTVSTGLRTWLAQRQIRHVARHRDAVPAAFADRIGVDAHRRAAAYTVARTRLGLIETIASAAVVVVLTMFGALQWLYDASAAVFPTTPMLAQIAFVLATMLATSAVELPIAWYRQFRLERRFGFNRMTPALFLADLAKSVTLGLLLGVPLLWVVLSLMQGAGDRWWIYAWLVWIGFNLFVLVAYPTVIAPLFNRFEPMPDSDARRRVEALLARCGFASKGLFVMDGSRRSSHGNAYFTGLGHSKRIVFFDTLLERLDASEVEAVLAHELGHFRHRHVQKRIGLAFAASLLGLWLLGWLANQTWFYQGLGLTPSPDMRDAAALVLFFIAMPMFTFPLAPLASMLSRRDEFEADAFAARQSDARALVAALVKLYKDNASTLTPDPIHSVFYDSHPPAAQRVRRLLAIAGETHARPA